MLCNVALWGSLGHLYLCSGFLLSLGKAMLPSLLYNYSIQFSKELDLWREGLSQVTTTKLVFYRFFGVAHHLQFTKKILT